MSPQDRSPAQRTQDTLATLATEVDAWVATADPDGGPYLVPLSFRWDGTELLLATASDTRTARNLRAVGRTRIGLGATRDVVLIDGEVEAVAAEDLGTAEGDAFAAATGFDPRDSDGPYTYFRVRPRWIQAWRSVAEQRDGPLMRDGVWRAGRP